MGTNKEPDRCLPEELIKSLQNEVVPLIIKTCRLAQDCYDLDHENNDNYIVGTFAWRNLFLRLCNNLDRKKWVVLEKGNDLRICNKVIEPELIFRIHRCDNETRVPTAGKTAKKSACRSFLSQEIEEIYQKKGSIVIAYDLDPLLGMKSISIERLVGNKPNDVIAFPIATLHESTAIDYEIDNINQAPPEKVISPSLILDQSKIDKGGASKLNIKK